MLVELQKVERVLIALLVFSGAVQACCSDEEAARDTLHALVSGHKLLRGLGALADPLGLADGMSEPMSTRTARARVLPLLRSLQVVRAQLL